MITNLTPDNVAARSKYTNALTWARNKGVAPLDGFGHHDFQKGPPIAEKARPQKRPLRLNLGCGNDLREGYVNVDNESGNRINGRFIQHDLSDFPWPFEDESVDEVLMWHVLEHLPDTCKVMDEIRRILKPGGIFRGQVSYAFGFYSLVHPQHYRHFTHHSFEKLGEDFGFEANTRPGNLAKTWRHSLLNLVPFKSVLCIFLMNIYNMVDFEMVKR